MPLAIDVKMVLVHDTPIKAALFAGFREVGISRICILTQFTTGGNRDADMATPIRGPAEPCSKATATPVPDVRAQSTPIHKARTLPLRMRFGRKVVRGLLKMET